MSNFVNDQEEKDYKALKAELKDIGKVAGKKVSDGSIRSIMLHMIKNRTKFSVEDQEAEFKQSMKEWLPFCFKDKKKKADGNNAYKKRRLFEKGSKRYTKEMDIVSVLKTLRITKVLFRTVMKQKHRVLSQIQRSEVISSDSSENKSSDHAELINGLDQVQSKPMKRIFTLGKVHRALREFCDDDAGEKGTAELAMTKRLLKGFYTQDAGELEDNSEQESAKYA